MTQPRGREGRCQDEQGVAGRIDDQERLGNGIGERDPVIDDQRGQDTRPGPLGRGGGFLDHPVHTAERRVHDEPLADHEIRRRPRGLDPRFLDEGDEPPVGRQRTPSAASEHPAGVGERPFRSIRGPGRGVPVGQVVGEAERLEPDIVGGDPGVGVHQFTGRRGIPAGTDGELDGVDVGRGESGVQRNGPLEGLHGLRPGDQEHRAQVVAGLTQHGPDLRIVGIARGQATQRAEGCRIGIAQRAFRGLEQCRVPRREPIAVAGRQRAVADRFL